MKMKRAVVDILSMVIFSLIVGIPLDVFVAKLQIIQMAYNRLCSTFINIIIARPYGHYQDWLHAKTKYAKRSLFLQILIDTFGFISIQVPAYFVLLLLNGAKTKQALEACLVTAFFSAGLGWIYGQFLRKFRKLFELPIAY
jgi:flagellar biosynthesis protein FliQ